MRKSMLCLSLLLLISAAQANTTKAPAEEFRPNADQQGAARMVYGVLSNSRYAYAPKALDDKLSADIFKRYLESLDGAKLYFTAADVAKFDELRTGFDDAIKGQTLQPAFDLYSLYLKRAKQRTGYAKKLLEKGFDFSTDEQWHYDREKAQWAKTDEELNDAWRKYVKNDWLRLKLAGRDDEQIRQTLSRRYSQTLNYITQRKPEDAFEVFMNAYATSIDPHTNYLSPRSAEEFNEQMRLSLEGIGAVLQPQDDLIVIRSLVPGGPAEMSGKLKPGDRIMAVGQSTGAMVDVIGWRLDDAVKLIKGKKGTTVRLDVLPSESGIDGARKLVQIVRDKVKLELQAARKQLIEMEGRRLGIIKLPGFYLDFEARRRGDADARSATNDVKKLLAELRKEDVEGVVVDLRGNGGGSLTEAVELTGLFIDKGPVVQVRESGGRVSVETDEDAGVAWKGPLAVLVDRSSASASEIFAAAIQDYGRGLIIGEPTFGKGTVQNLIDLDRWPRNNAEPRFGQVKLTIAQFFRVDGGTTQHTGVIPDMQFPITFGADEFGESSYDNALPSSQIEAAPHDDYGNFRPLLAKLDNNHHLRIKKDKEWQWWEEDVAKFKVEREKALISLNETKRRQERDQDEAKRKQRDAIRKELGLDQSIPSRADDGLTDAERDVAQADAEAKAARDRIDPILRESAAILADSIGMLSSNKQLTAQVFPGSKQALVWTQLAAKAD